MNRERINNWLDMHGIPKKRTWIKDARESDTCKGMYCWTGEWCRERILAHMGGFINLYDDYPKWEVEEIFKVAQVGSLERLEELI